MTDQSTLTDFGSKSGSESDMYECEICERVFDSCELPHPARPDGLAEGGASCFCVGACIRRGHIGSRLRRRGFGVSHSYWFDGVVPWADTRFLPRLNVGLLSSPSARSESSRVGRRVSREW